MSKKKLIVDQYDPIIYPWKLFVVKNYLGNKKLKKLFDLTDEEINDDSEYAITIFGAHLKSTNEVCCVVLLSDKTIKSKDKVDQIDTCSHEAGHYVLHLMECIGNERYTGNHEPYCYLLGWATGCIYRTLIK